MDSELKCPACTDYYANPVLLPCNHSICKGCALRLQIVNNVCDDRRTSSSTDYSDNADKMSVYSEADSGVSLTGSSRPNSYIGSNATTSYTNLLQLTPAHENFVTISCPRCRHRNCLGRAGVGKLPADRLLETILCKHLGKKTGRHCQMCSSRGRDSTSSDSSDDCTTDIVLATCMCADCEEYYCKSCAEKCHPLEGPLSSHTLVSAEEGYLIQLSANKTRDAQCYQHCDDVLTMFCNQCKVPVCYTCVKEGSHLNHDVSALNGVCMAKKNRLKTGLQSLSEKAKAGSTFRLDLLNMTEQVQTNSQACKDMVEAQCQALIETVERKRAELLGFIEADGQQRIRALKDQAAECAAHVQKATALLQFSVEALKEPDNLSFVQSSAGITSRVSSAEKQFNKEVELRPRISPFCELTLDNRAGLCEIENMHFFQMKVPGPPAFVPEECSSENNAVTLVWQPYRGSLVEAYVLELDDGLGGNFREVYCGPDTVCHVDGLHFDSMYTARVKCYNQQGESAYGECICLQTAEVAWFNFDANSAHKDILLSEDGNTVTCNNFEDRVALGSIGFTRGVHYWEYRVDRYENHPDPSFGVARLEASRDCRLGRDQLGWSMYADKNRSWFMHGGEHTERCDGGISKGSVVGVKLDLNKHTVSYFVNGRPHGPVAFTDMHGVFFPAVSVNRNVQVTLRTARHAPDSED